MVAVEQTAGSVRRRRGWRNLALAMGPALGLVLGDPAQAWSQEGQALGYAEALSRSLASAGTLRAAELDAEAKGLQADALGRLEGPALSLSGFSGRVATTLNLDLARAADALAPGVDGLDRLAPGLDPLGLPRVLSRDRVFNLGSVGLGANWPLYTGGRLDALHKLAEGRAEEARAERTRLRYELSTQVAERYFTVQLARQALAVRAAAVDAIAGHQRSAARLEEIGLIARADRLRADVALDEAQRDRSAAESDLQLATLALRRLLNLGEPVAPSTPLFVHADPVGTLEDFLEVGMLRHPAWRTLASLEMQAEQVARVGGSEFAPTVLAVGNYTLNQSTDDTIQPDWVLGIYVAYPLFSRVDRSRTREAARLQRERVSARAEQARRDVPTLIESLWRSMENARTEFLATRSGIELARENVHLQRVAFEQAQTTSQEVTDARLTQAAAEIGRSQAAYRYVLALARLLEATGQPERLAELAASAEYRLEAEESR
ncbi:MAG: TolC family protein [Gemmatimonadota bacterium]